MSDQYRKYKLEDLESELMMWRNALDAVKERESYILSNLEAIQGEMMKRGVLNI